MVQKLLALVGMPGAGKSTVSDFFSSKGVPVLRFGDQTDIGLKELGLPINEENERTYREDLRKQLGMAAMAIKIQPRIEDAAKSAKCIVLDGLYSWEERKHLMNIYPSMKLLHVYADREIRYERLAKRKIRPLTREEAESRDTAEIEHLNKGGPIAMADWMIDNSGSENDLTVQLEKFYTQFI